MSTFKETFFPGLGISGAMGSEEKDVPSLVGKDRYFSATQAIQDPSKLIQHLKLRGIGVIPTDTLYGLATPISDDSALERLFRMKGRALERQIPVLIENPEKTLPHLVSELPKKAQALIENFWPGPLTLVLPASPLLSRYITGNTASVGVRQSAHPVVRAIIQALGSPITGTSANLTGGRSPISLAQVDAAILREVDFVIDGGVLGGRLGSTVIDFTGPEAKILRQGDLPLARIQEVIAL